MMFLAALPVAKKKIAKFYYINNEVARTTSDESEPIWLEPQLELKDFQLGSACDLFHFSSELEKIMIFSPEKSG